MIPNREQLLNQKELEALKQKNQIASILMEDPTFNIVINKKREELSDKEFLKWLDQIKRQDQQKQIVYKEVGQIKNQVNKSKQLNIKYTQTNESHKITSQMEQQLELQKLQAQIKQKIQKAQNNIDRQRLGEVPTKNFTDKQRTEQNQKALDEMLREKQKEQERQDYLINQNQLKNSKLHDYNKQEIETNTHKLKKYQSPIASKDKLLTKVTKSIAPPQKKQI